MSAATAAPSATSFENKGRPWWMMLIEGIALTIIGAVLLWAPAKTAAATWVLIVTFLGIWWIVRGILDIVSIFIDKSAWGWKLFMGIISLIAGGYIVMYPIAAAVVVPQVFALVLGIWGLVQGIVMLMLAFRGGGWGPGILGVLAILFGIFLIGNYGDFGMALAFVWAAAVLALVGGIVIIVQSLRTRSA